MTPRELYYLITMNASTKAGDFTKIGQFGVGFKYWWFFNSVSIEVSDGDYVHRLNYNDFNTVTQHMNVNKKRKERDKFYVH